MCGYGIWNSLRMLDGYKCWFGVEGVTAWEGRFEVQGSYFGVRDVGMLGILGTFSCGLPGAML